MLGQGIRPSDYHPMVDGMKDDEVSQFLANVKRVIDKSADIMLQHEQFIAKHCAAAPAI